MNTEKPTPLSLYIRAVLPEREAYLHDQAVRRARPFVRGMRPEQARAYYESAAFKSLLYRTRRQDKTYQALLRGELTLDSHRAEFDRLSPLIEHVMARGDAVDVAFLRSVLRSRASLEAACEAVAQIERRAPRRVLDGQVKRFVGETCARLEQHLLKCDLRPLAPEAPAGQTLAACIAARLSEKGALAPIVDAAWQPKSLSDAMRSEIRRALPELAACGGVRTPSGATVSDSVKADVRRAKKEICAQVRRRFPQERLRKLLSQNPSLKRLQRQMDAAAEKEQRLRRALLDAVPRHYRDLYPLARAMRRRFILHIGPTNSGKTYEGVGRLHGARHGIYLGPLRLLAAEQFETLNMNDVPCSLVTGEEQIWVPGSRVQSSTVEMADLKARYDVAVIDECQMIADRDRGGAWTSAILGLCADEIHACASPDAEELLKRIILDCGDELSVVRHERMTPLEVEHSRFQFPTSVRPGDALIVFSKARVHAVAAELRRKGWRVALIYGALPPDVRRDQALRFQNGDAEVVVSTDAIAMGMNLPIERVVFLESEKYDGDITRPLLDSEIVQIAGRAGRFGQYEIGYVNAFGFAGVVERALKKPLLPIMQGIIGFPESLLGIPLPLTQIINQWLIMEDRGCFSKASAQRMQTLAAMMETPRTDKALLYRFLCIPFDESDPDLLARWRAMYQAECARAHIDVVAQLPDYLDPETCTTEMLDGLETDYRRCDLYYNYARLFLKEPESVLDEIQRRKSLLSEGIIHVLSTQKLQQKTCPVCHRPLPWNWPYRLCDGCYRNGSFRRGAGRTAKKGTP